MQKPCVIDSIELGVDRVLAELPDEIVLGTPLGIGKPVPFLNALYRRIKADPQRRLKLYTALSLQKPVGETELERRFLEPFVARVFGECPDLDYVTDLQAQKLPPNIEVSEFFFKSGAFLENAAAQQSYIATNYTFVARDLALHGVNLVVQAVAAVGEGDKLRLSLSSNCDVTAELLERLRARPGHRVLAVAVINRQLPFMPNAAEVPPDFFDLIITDAAGTHALFSPPNMKVTAQDYAIGLHAASLVPDGGTVQIGIGALGDAIAQALILRAQHNDDFRQLVGACAPESEARDRELEPFSAGLYACSEMFGNGLLKLLEAGVLRREVFHDETLQRLLNDGRIRTEVDLDTLRALHAAGRVSSPLTNADVDFLRRFGVLKPDVTHEAAMSRIGADLLGSRLRGGIVLHGGFFLGPRDFYAALHALPDETLRKIEMHRIDFINQLAGHEGLARAQRRKARFMNTVMMVTLLGAAISDGLESGQVVSGVGGQYNFVAMGHALADGRSILLLRACRESRGEVTSNIVWQYEHCTIPRHLRDLVVTEYGVADLRGQPDAEVIKRLLAIADSRFQPDLLATARRHGKVEKDYQLPDSQRQNLPARLEDALRPFAHRLPAFPFGTDFTDDEQAMLAALQRMKHASEHPLELVELAWRSLFRGELVPPRYLERLGLDEAHGLRQRLMRRLFLGSA